VIRGFRGGEIEASPDVLIFQLNNRKHWLAATGYTNTQHKTYNTESQFKMITKYINTTN